LKRKDWQQEHDRPIKGEEKKKRKVSRTRIDAAETFSDPRNKAAPCEKDVQRKRDEVLISDEGLGTN